jgi:hypothetical protein
MAESVRARANRYARGDFTKRELTTLSGVLLADKAIDIATFGKLNKLSAKALFRIVFPVVTTTGRIAGNVALGAGRVLGSSAIGAAAPIVTNPYVAGTALGLGALATPPGQALLEAAEERGRMDRIRAEQYLTDVQSNLQQFRQDPISVFEQAVAGSGATTITGRRKGRSAFNTAVSKGLKAIKKSSSYGKKGIISTPKKAFGFVAKTVSKLRRGKKVPSKGASGVVKRSLGNIKITVRKP